jgi:hypothetical protein
MWPEKDEPGRLVDDRVEERSVSSNGGVGWRWPGLFEAEGGAGGGFGAVLVDGDVRPIDGLAQKDSGCDAAVAATGNLDTELLERIGEIDAGVEVPLREREVDDPAGQRGVDAVLLRSVEPLLERGEVVGDEHAHGRAAHRDRAARRRRGRPRRGSGPRARRCAFCGRSVWEIAADKGSPAKTRTDR